MSEYKNSKIESLHANLLSIENESRKKANIYSITITFILSCLLLFVLIKFTKATSSTVVLKYAVGILLVAFLLVYPGIHFVVYTIIHLRKSEEIDNINDQISNLYMIDIKKKIRQEIGLSDFDKGKLYATYLKDTSNDSKSKLFFNRNKMYLSALLKLSDLDINEIHESVYDKNQIEIIDSNNQSTIYPFTKNDVVELMKTIYKND